MALGAEEFRRWDAALGDQGLLLAWDEAKLLGIDAYSFEAPDLVFERREISEQLEQNKLDDMWWGANRSWHRGAGQTRLHMPDVSTPYGFKESKGVDITTEGQLTLLKSVTKVLTLSNTDPFSQKMIATEAHVWVAGANPNVKRFSALDASDATDVNTATESGIGTYDISTDGQQVYVALAGDGIHRMTGDTYSTLLDFDATTNWTAGSNVTMALDTSKYKEATGSLKFTRSGGSTSTIATYTWGGAQDLSSVVNFRIWVYATRSIVDFKLRFTTSTGNYYESDAVTTQRSGWVQLTFSRAGDFTATGSPNWASVASFQLIGSMQDSQDLWVDNLEQSTAGSFAHWSDWDARQIAWAKGNLYAAGVKSGTTWRFFTAASGAGSTEHATLPDGWEVTDICELGGFIYYSAKRANRGVVYAYDGNNAPFVALSLDPGEVPLSLTPFSGAGILIGTLKVGTDSSAGGPGVLYRAFPTGSGHLTSERIVELGSGDGNSYAPLTGFQWGRYVYFGWPFAETGSTVSTGLGVYDPETGAYARHLYTSATTGQVVGACVFRGRRMFSVDGEGVFVEDTTYLASGTLTSSIIDLNVASPKMWLAAEIGYSLPSANQSVALDYSTDGGTTWTAAISAQTSGDRKRSAINISARSIQYRLTLAASTNTATPTVYDAGLGGFPTQLPGKTHRMVVRAYPHQELKTKEQLRTPNGAWTLINQLLTHRDSATAVTFQDPFWPAHSTTKTVRVTKVQPLGPFVGDDPGGILLLEVKEVT